MSVAEISKIAMVSTSGKIIFNTTIKLMRRQSSKNGIPAGARNFLYLHSSVVILLGVNILSALYYLLYHGIVGLHDITHYVTSGVQMVRDQSAVVYPYSNINPGISQTAYAYFQSNSQILDATRDLPAKGFSLVFGLGYLLTGKVLFSLTHFLNFFLFCISNVLLFQVLRTKLNSLFSFLGLLAILYTPLMNGILYPSNGVTEYFAISLFLWFTLKLNLSTFHIAVILGGLGVYRPQIMFLSLLLIFFEDQDLRIHRKLRLAGINLVITFAVYRTTELAISYFFYGRGLGGNSNFYIETIKIFLMQAGSPLQALDLIFQNTSENIKNLGSPTALYIFVLSPLLLLMRSCNRAKRKILFAGLASTIPPLAVYSIDPLNAIQPRYFVTSLVFMIVFAWLTLFEGPSTLSIPRVSTAFLIFLIVLVPYLSSFGVPISNVSTLQSITSRFTFLDDKGFGNALDSNFTDKDVILTNNSLPNAYKKFKYVIPIPPIQEFMSGDNRYVSGILLTDSIDVMNGFFNANDYKVNGILPKVISDDYGVQFNLVAKVTHRLTDQEGSTAGKIQLLAYKNSGNFVNRANFQPGKTKIGYPVSLSLGLLEAPNFESLKPWGREIGRYSGAHVKIGPGRDNLNVLKQIFPSIPAENLQVKITARSGTTNHAVGFFQVIWLDRDGNFLKSTDSKYFVGKPFQDFRFNLEVPQDAFFGVVYAAPFGEQDVLDFRFLDVYRVL